MPGARGALTEKIPDCAERKRRFPIGAEVVDGRIDFRVWALGQDGVEVVIEHPGPAAIPMAAEDNGYFSALVPHPGRGCPGFRFETPGSYRWQSWFAG